MHVFDGLSKAPFSHACLFVCSNVFAHSPFCIAHLLAGWFGVDKDDYGTRLVCVYGHCHPVTCHFIRYVSPLKTSVFPLGRLFVLLKMIVVLTCRIIFANLTTLFVCTLSILQFCYSLITAKEDVPVAVRLADAATVETSTLASLDFKDPGSPESLLEQAARTRSAAAKAAMANPAAEDPELAAARILREKHAMHFREVDQALQEEKLDSLIEQKVTTGADLDLNVNIGADSQAEAETETETEAEAETNVKGRPRRGGFFSKLKRKFTATKNKAKTKLAAVKNNVKAKFNAAKGKIVSAIKAKLQKKAPIVPPPNPAPAKAAAAAAAASPASAPTKRKPPGARLPVPVSVNQRDPFVNLGHKPTLEDYIYKAQDGIYKLGYDGVPVTGYMSDIVDRIKIANSDNRNLAQDIKDNVVSRRNRRPRRRPVPASVARINRIKNPWTHLRSNMDVIDCAACRFAWLKVEMDLGNSRALHRLYDAFVEHCAGMQESNIFFNPCNKMFGKIDKMIADYVTGNTVNQLCMKAKMCR